MVIDDHKGARNRAKLSLGVGLEAAGEEGDEVPAGFVHNPQQELRRVEKARGPNIRRTAKGAKIRKCQVKRRSRSLWSPWVQAFCPTGTMLPVHSLPLATTCAASCPDQPRMSPYRVRVRPAALPTLHCISIAFQNSKLEQEGANINKQYL